MENTLENKARFFAQYWGQRVLTLGTNDNYPIITSWMSCLMAASEANGDYKQLLQLKPVSSISMQDAIEVIKLCEGSVSDDLEFTDRTGESFASPKQWRQFFYVVGKGTINEKIVFVANFSNEKNGVSIYVGNEYWRCHINALDFLRSKGYALPYMGLNIEAQIEYGWIKLIE